MLTRPNVTNIGEGAFDLCTSLTNLLVFLNVTNIGDGAFAGCFSLPGVIIGANVTNIGQEAFIGCFSLNTIMVDTNNPVYSSVAGVLFNKRQMTLIQYPGGMAGNYTISNGVTSIGASAFIGSVSLRNVTIPDSVTSVGYSAFSGCPSLTGIYFMGNAPSPGQNYFSGETATVYYLPGTTGWGAIFGGLPTVLWNPQAQTADSSFGVQNNQFGFNITGSSNLVIVVEACTDLANPAWSPVSTNTLNAFVGTNGISYFSDPQWTNYPNRFYRLRSP